MFVGASATCAEETAIRSYGAALVREKELENMIKEVREKCEDSVKGRTVVIDGEQFESMIHASVGYRQLTTVPDVCENEKIHGDDEVRTVHGFSELSGCPVHVCEDCFNSGDMEDVCLGLGYGHCRVLIEDWEKMVGTVVDPDLTMPYYGVMITNKLAVSCLATQQEIKAFHEEEKSLEPIKDNDRFIFVESLHGRTRVVNYDDYKEMMLRGIGYGVISNRDTNWCSNMAVHGCGGKSLGLDGTVTSRGYTDHDDPYNTLFLCETCYNSPYRTGLFMGCARIHGGKFRVNESDYKLLCSAREKHKQAGERNRNYTMCT